MAMSGGIDSTVSAMLLLEQGYELVGVTFRTFDSMRESCIAKEKGCCTIDSIMEAKHLAERLGFEHHIVDYRDTFRSCVVGNFIDEYMHGRTPNPCVVCNSTIKWGKLLELADELGCQKIATGHYARIVCENGHYYLRAAADTHKDQTYFLWRLTEANLGRTIFPLGDYTKTQVREMAAERGFTKLAQKGESQEICFIPNNNYRDFLQNNVPNFSEVCKPGRFVDAEGKTIGKHEGFPNYTIGQRKGLKVAFGTPKFVTKIDADRNIVTLGDRDDLYATTLTAGNCIFTNVEQLVENPVVQARIRYKSPATEARLSISGDTCVLDFSEPVWGVTPGQSLVLYQGDKVVGGGIIL
ncbi:MAG: tRNA 2-thiouridine(34) synthase MnmA [Fibrobacter sp.]|nr:tRNA 2-thiouridine(34) synthase MnmA [Bacteroidales bacterium]MCF0225714.1 tRNA 2-thiouridine(34) synthase MnmA [Fibrobacter sp.]